VGATDGPTELGGSPASTSLRVEPASGPAARALDFAQAPPQAVFLNVENVVGTRPSTNYDVYVNLPEDAGAEEREQRLAGVMTTFGIERASRADDPHGGSGLNMAFDITDLVQREQEDGTWDLDSLRVTFVPDRASPELPPVTVGQVSLYYKR
jgi:tyrosinase